jgi:hypothetical protein
MSPLPEMIIAALAPFAGLFSSAVWGHAQVLMIGAILCQGPRTVAAILRGSWVGTVVVGRNKRSLRSVSGVLERVVPVVIFLKPRDYRQYSSRPK